MPKPRLCIWAGESNKGNIVRPQRGDVVDVIWNDKFPGKEVYGHPNWRIVDVDVQVDDPIKYMGWIIEEDSAPEGWLRWFRRWGLNLDELEREEEKKLGRSLANDDLIIVEVGRIKGLAKMKISLPDYRIIR